MVDLVVSPLSFAPTKVGYKQYLKSGGVMQYPSFVIFERRTEKQIIAENINRVHSAMLYAYDQAILCLKDCDSDGYILYMDTAEIRSKQLAEYHQKLSLLDN